MDRPCLHASPLCAVPGSFQAVPDHPAAGPCILHPTRNCRSVWLSPYMRCLSRDARMRGSSEAACALGSLVPAGHLGPPCQCWALLCETMGHLNRVCCVCIGLFVRRHALAALLPWLTLPCSLSQCRMSWVRCRCSLLLQAAFAHSLHMLNRPAQTLRRKHSAV